MTTLAPVARHRRRRNWGARILEYSLQGMRCVFLENERLRVGFLADKGTDVFELNYKPRDLDFAWLSAGGVRDPRAFAPSTFVDSYPGGWQEVLPNGGAPSSYLGAEFDQHAEISLLPWDYVILEDGEDEVAVVFSVAAQKVPLRLTKEVRLGARDASLSIAETLVNESDVPVRLMWGHHITFGPPFLRPGCRIELPEGSEPAVRVLPEQGAPSDIVYLSGFDEGRYAVTDPGGELGFRVEWDATTMPYLWFWQEYGATRGYPWYGRHYNIGLEPFTSYPTDGLAEAVRNGTALELGGRERREFSLVATVLDEDGGRRWS